MLCKRVASQESHTTKTGIPSIISDDNGMPVFHFLSGISAHTNGDIHRRENAGSFQRRMCRLWLRVSNRDEQSPVGTRFCLQSLVCYTFCSADAKQMLWHGKGADDSVQRSASEYRLTLFHDSTTGGFWIPITKYRFASCKIRLSVDLRSR